MCSFILNFFIVIDLFLFCNLSIFIYTIVLNYVFEFNYFLFKYSIACNFFLFKFIFLFNFQKKEIILKFKIHHSLKPLVHFFRLRLDIFWPVLFPIPLLSSSLFLNQNDIDFLYTSVFSIACICPLIG